MIIIHEGFCAKALLSTMDSMFVPTAAIFEILIVILSDLQPPLTMNFILSVRGLNPSSLFFATFFLILS